MALLVICLAYVSSAGPTQSQDQVLYAVRLRLNLIWLNAILYIVKFCFAECVDYEFIMDGL